MLRLCDVLLFLRSQERVTPHTLDVDSFEELVEADDGLKTHE